MKTLILALVLIGNYAMAGSQPVSVELKNFSCNRGPFGRSRMQAVLPAPIGSLGEKGILNAGFLNMRLADCQNIITDLGNNAHDGVVDLVAQVNTLTTIRIHQEESLYCETAREETVSIQLTPEVALSEGANTNGFQSSECPSARSF